MKLTMEKLNIILLKRRGITRIKYPNIWPPVKSYSMMSFNIAYRSDQGQGQDQGRIPGHISAQPTAYVFGQ